MWPVIDSSALIGENFIFQKKKTPLQDLLSSVNALISTYWIRIEFVTGHMTYNSALTNDNRPYLGKNSGFCVENER